MKVIYLSGIVGWDITADGIRNKIDINSKERLQVIVNSPGGYVYDAFEIYDLFETYKGEIEFVIMAYAASAMSYIVMSGDKISAFKNSIWMAHKVQGVTIGDDEDMFRDAEIFRGMNNVIAEAYTKRLSGTKEEIIARMKAEIWAIGWEQLTEMGLIDNVIDNPEEIEIPDITEDEKNDLIIILTENIENEKLSSNGRTKIMAVRNKIQKDEEKMKENVKKAAAFLNIKQESNTDKTVDDKNLNTEDNKMPKLDELLQSNPEAQAEYTANLQAAEQKGKDEAMQENDVLKERQRIFDILEDSGIDPSNEALKAIDDGISADQFARNELKRQRDKRADEKNKVEFGKLKDSTMPGDQDIKGKKETQERNNAKKDTEEFDKESEALADKHFGGKK